jgi:chitodextrinase
VSAASKHTALAFVSLALVASLTVAGSAAGGGNAKYRYSARDRQPPTAPTNLRVTATAPFSLSFAWDAATDNVGVAGYYLYVIDGHGDGRRTRVTGTTYDAGGLGCGQSVDFWVTAYDSSGNRSPQVSVTAPTAACPDVQAPTTPTGFVQQATTQSAVVLSWTPSTDNVGVVGYDVYRSTLLVSRPADPTVTLSGLNCGSAYQYAVDAVDAAGNRSGLGTAWVQTGACGDSEAPTPPSNLVVTAHTASSLSVSWTPSNDNVGVAGYRVSLDGVPSTSVAGTSATISNLKCGTAYTVAVDAFDAAGNRSAAATTKPTTDDCAPVPSSDATPPTQPSGLTSSSVTQTGLVLSWNP